LLCLEAADSDLAAGVHRGTSVHRDANSDREADNDTGIKETDVFTILTHSYPRPIGLR
jgi:hypothetical protein